MPTPFTQQIFALVASIPAGKVLSYGQIALLCGRPRASRIVGAAVANGPPGLPYHRVVYQDGVWSSTVSGPENLLPPPRIA